MAHAIVPLFWMYFQFLLVAGCRIAMNGGLPDPQPLLLQMRESNDGNRFYLPRSDKHIYFHAGDMVHLFCTGQGNKFKQNFFHNIYNHFTDIVATCVNDTTFSVFAQEFHFKDLDCTFMAKYEVRRTRKHCYNGNYLIEVGFLADNDFVKIIDICFEAYNRNVLWSKFDLVSVINGAQTAPLKTSFDDPYFFPGMQPDEQYSQTNQQKTFARLLGEGNAEIKNLTNRLFNGSESYLVKSHLTTKADFVYAAQQEATFLFINVAPQWQMINNGNWKKIEDNVRNFASRYDGHLVVYTGTHRITSYRNINDNWTDMALSVDENGNRQIPVPALFWKVIHDPVNKKGAAIFCVNNPHMSDEDVADQIRLYVACASGCPSWIEHGFYDTDVKKGLVYCCDHPQIQSALPSLPELEWTSTLI